MEHLKETERFKIFEEDDDLVDFLREFVIWVEDLHSDKVERINWLLNRIKPDAAELIPSGSLVGDDGNWRFYLSGNNLTVQRKESGTWVTKWTYEPS